MRLYIGMSIVLLALFISVQAAEAGFLYHATSKAAAKRIARNGFSKSHLNPNGRFGAKAYVASRPSTALRERPGADAILRFKSNGNFNKNIIDTRKMKTADLKTISGRNDMRGTRKHNIIGPKIGRDIGKKAEKSNSIIAYRSAKNPHSTNYAIPEKSYKNSAMLKPDKIVNVN